MLAHTLAQSRIRGGLDGQERHRRFPGITGHRQNWQPDHAQVIRQVQVLGAVAACGLVIRHATPGYSLHAFCQNAQLRPLRRQQRIAGMPNHQVIQAEERQFPGARQHA